MDNHDEVTFWNQAGGETWSRLQPQIDVLFQHINATLLQQCRPQNGQHFVDIGCGSGALSLALAQSLGANGSVTALDVSDPLLALAKTRAESLRNHAYAPLAPVTWTLADASAHRFAQPFDTMVSRFGVMFFDTPVLAFQHLRKALKPGAALHFAAWQRIEDNPWFKVPRDIAIEQLGPVPDKDPRAPGPTAFADTEYVTDILESAGFTAVSIEVTDLPLHVDGDATACARFASVLGPVSRIVQQKQAEKPAIDKLRAAIAERFIAYEQQPQQGQPPICQVPAKINFVRALNPT